jgi:prepilin-type N-terminal cleavage/methylation domain-containing protein
MEFPEVGPELILGLAMILFSNGDFFWINIYYEFNNPRRDSKMVLSRKKMQRGVTLTELLVVLAIIGLLATIAVPVYVNKMEQAKVSTAKHEVLELANAEDVCGILHGYYVPLCMLDDLPQRSGTRPDAVDDVENSEANLDPYLINTGVPIEDQDGSDQVRLSTGLSNNTRSVEMLYYAWQGNFINFKRYYLGNNIYTPPENPQDADVAKDYPLDPWGNPYIMLSEFGRIEFDGRITNNEIDHNFDRMTIMSLGPDGTVDIEGNTFVNPSSTDDVWVHFGSAGLQSETYY